MPEASTPTRASSGLCECGCGDPAPVAKYNRVSDGSVKGQPKRFIHGHHVRGARNPNFGKKGAKSHLWKGSRRIQLGYVYVNVEDSHPHFSMAINIGGLLYIAEHRLVMAEHIGRSLAGGWDGEIVHHKLECEGGSGDKSDNRIENLTLFPDASAHASHHAALRAATE